MKSVYRNLVSFQKAIELVNEMMSPVAAWEKVSLSQASGRISYIDVVSRMSIPPFNRSTMDGYAVRAEDLLIQTGGKPARLRVTGSVSIGEIPNGRINSGECMRISTGAILPEGSDAVVRIEDTREDGSFVSILEGVGTGENIAESGSDSAEGSLIISRGHVVQPHEVAVLASLGISELQVFRKLKISVISTGNELIPAGSPYTPGKVYDSNSHMVFSTLSAFNFLDTKNEGLAPDDWNRLETAIKSSLEGSDMVILSGGSSAGEADLVYRIIGNMEPGIIFHGVLAKPGLPTVFGMNGSKAVIGLPGFPVSAAMILRSIFLPGIIRMAGGSYPGEMLTTRLGARLNLEIGKQNLIPARLGSSAVYPVTGLSGSISRFLETTGYLSLPGTSKFLEEGSKVNYIPWPGNFWQQNMQLIGTIDSLNITAIRDALPETLLSYGEPETALSMLRYNDASNVILRVSGQESDIPQIIGIPNEEKMVAFLVAGYHIAVKYGDNYLKIDELDKLPESVKILGPPLKSLDRIMGKSQEEKNFLSSLRRNLTRYYTGNSQADIRIEIGDGNDTSHSIMIFHDVIVSRETGNNILEQLRKKFTQIRKRA